MKNVKLFLVAGLLLVAAALPLYAFDYANFQGNCAAGIPTVCDFDAGRTPAGPLVDPGARRVFPFGPRVRT